MIKKLSRSVAKRSPCPVATALDLVGDKWSLLIIRDIGFFARHRNKDFQQGVEGIPSNILANRLKMLLDNRLIRRIPYQSNPLRYEYFLTEAGEDLLPVVKAMAKWGDIHVAGSRMPRRFQ
ncbi:MAG: helix-turn-helix transcriptional regulator [Pseudomonadales bacterium]|nr:helix-turn-helix transcriptional regulator [Pseudomonadales bacterium]